MGNLLVCDNPWVPLPCEVASYWHHSGVDYLLGSSTSSEHSNNRPVYAVDNGVVVFSTNGNPNPDSARGGLVVIKHVAPPGVKFYIPSYRENFSGSTEFEVVADLAFSDEIVSYYLHLDEPLVEKGDEVSRGGHIANTYGHGDGYAYSPHLHFEIWRKCSRFDPNGYETEYLQFQDTVRNLVTHPDRTIRWNSEMMNVVREGALETSLVRARGYDFGPQPGTLILGSHVPISFPAVSVTESDWDDSAVRFDLFAPWQTVAEARWQEYPNHGVDVTIRKDGAAAHDRSASFPFRDVPSTKWYAEYVVYLERIGVISGFGNTRFFLPHEPIKRSEFLKLLVANVCPQLMVGEPCTADSSPFPFTDLEDHWVRSFVREAWNRGWLTASVEFRPGDLVVRAEAAKLVAKALEVAEATPSGSPLSCVEGIELDPAAAEVDEGDECAG